MLCANRTTQVLSQLQTLGLSSVKGKENMLVLPESVYLSFKSNLWLIQAIVSCNPTQNKD